MSNSNDKQKFENLLPLVEKLCSISDKEDAISEAHKSWKISTSETEEFFKYLAHDLKHPLLYRLLRILFDANKVYFNLISELVDHYKATFELKVLFDILQWKNNFYSNLTSKSVTWPRKNYYNDKNQLHVVIVRTYGLEEVWVHFLYMTSKSDHRKVDEGYSISRLMEDFFHSFTEVEPRTPQATYQLLLGKMYLLHFLLITFQCYEEIFPIFQEILSFYKEIENMLPHIITTERELYNFHLFRTNLLYRYYTRYGSTYQVYVLLKEMCLYPLASREDIFYINLQHIGLTCLFQSIDQGLKECKAFHNLLKTAVDTKQIYSSLLVTNVLKELEQYCQVLTTFPIEFATFIEDSSLCECLPVFHKIAIPNNSNDNGIGTHTVDYIFFDDANQDVMKHWSFEKQWAYLKYRIHYWAFVLQQPYRAGYMVKLMHDLWNVETENRNKKSSDKAADATGTGTGEMAEKFEELRTLRWKVYCMPAFDRLTEAVDKASSSYFYCQFNSTYLYQHMLGIFYYGDKQPTWTRSDRMFELQLVSYIQAFTLYDIYYHRNQYENRQQQSSSTSLLPLPKQYWKYFPEIFKRASTYDQTNYFKYHFLTLALKLCNCENSSAISVSEDDATEEHEDILEKHNLLAAVYYRMGSLNTEQHDAFINMNTLTEELYWNKLFDLFLVYIRRFQTRAEPLNQNKDKLDIPEGVIVYILQIFRSSHLPIVTQHPVLHHKFFQLVQLLMKGMQNKLSSSSTSSTAPTGPTTSAVTLFLPPQVHLSPIGFQCFDLTISNPTIWYDLFASNFHPSSAWNIKDTLDKFLNDLVSTFDEFYMKTYFFNKLYPEIIQSNQLLQEVMIKIAEIQQLWISVESADEKQKSSFKTISTTVNDKKVNWILTKCNEYELWNKYIQPYLSQQVSMILFLRSMKQCHITERYEETNIEFNCAYEILNFIRFIQLFSFDFLKILLHTNLIEITNYYNIAISSIDRITKELQNIRTNIKDIRIFRNAYIMKLLFSMYFIVENPTIYEFCNVSQTSFMNVPFGSSVKTTVSSSDQDAIRGQVVASTTPISSSLSTNPSAVSSPSPSKETRFEEVVTLAASAVSTISKIQQSGWSSDLIHLTTIVPPHRGNTNLNKKEIGSSSAVGKVVHICATPRCGKPADMSCPTCIKLGIPPSRFCDQVCFESNWSLHKLLHTQAKKQKQLLLPIESIISIQRSTGGVMDCDLTAAIYRCFEWLLPFQIYTYCNELPKNKIRSEKAPYWTKVDIHQPFSNDFYANGSLEYLESLFLAPFSTDNISTLEGHQSSLHKLKYLHICGGYNWIHFSRFCNYLLLSYSPSPMTNGIAATTSSMGCLHTLKIAYNRLAMNRIIPVTRQGMNQTTCCSYDYNTKELFCNAIKYCTSLERLVLYVIQSEKVRSHSKLTIDAEFLDALAEALAFGISRIKRLTIDNVYLPFLNLQQYSITKFFIKPNRHVHHDYQGWRRNPQLRYQLIQSKQFEVINSSLQYIDYNMNYVNQSTLPREKELQSILTCLDLLPNMMFNWEDSGLWIDRWYEMLTMIQNRSIGVVERINLHQLKLQSYPIDLLSSQLYHPHGMKLKTLALTNNCLTLQQLAQLIEMWIERQHFFPELEEIDLHSCCSSDPFYAPMPSMMDEEMLDKVIFGLSSAIQNRQFPLLKSLNLSSLHLQDIHVIALMSVLTESNSPICCRITRLNLSHNHLTSASIASLSEWIRLSTSPIHQLLLEGNIQISTSDSNRLISEAVIHARWMRSYFFVYSMHVHSYPMVSLLVDVYNQLEEKFADIASYDNVTTSGGSDNNGGEKKSSIADYLFIPSDVAIDSMFGYYLQWWKVLYPFMNLKQQCQIQTLSLEVLIDSMTTVSELIGFVDYYLVIIESQPIIDKNSNCIKTASNIDMATVKYQNICPFFSRILELPSQENFYVILDWILLKHAVIDGSSSSLCETIMTKGIAAIGSKETNNAISWFSSQHLNTTDSAARDSSVLSERFISEDRGLNILNFYLWRTTHKVNVAVQVISRLDMQIKTVKADQSTSKNSQQRRLQHLENARFQLVKNFWYCFLTVENHYAENQSFIDLIVQQKLQEWRHLENEFILSRQQSRQQLPSRGSEVAEDEGTLFNLPLEEALFAYLVIRYFIRVAPTATVTTTSNGNTAANAASLSFRILSSNSNNTGTGNSFQRNEVLFLLNIPSVRGIVSQDLKSYQIKYGENHLLRLAIESNKPEAMAVLLTVDTVRALAERNNYYTKSNQRGVELRRLAADTESSMVSLTSGEEGRLQRLMEHYAPIIDSMGGIMAVFQEFVKRLEVEYKAKPAIINIIDYDSPVHNTTTVTSTAEDQTGTTADTTTTQSATNEPAVNRATEESYEDPGIRADTFPIELPLKWSEYITEWKSDLYPPEQQRALIAYHKHTVHTAWRYLQKPNYWIDTNAMYVETMPNDSTLHYSTFKQYIPLIVLFYVAAIDETHIGPEQYTPTQRYDHFLMELCYINRAHNWDTTRWNPSTEENEEYDNILQGDRPSCYSGVKRRLFQSLLDHPLFIPLTVDVIYQELRDFLKVLFRNKLQECKQQPWYPTSLSVASTAVGIDATATTSTPVVAKKTVLTVFDRVKQAWYEWIEDLNPQSLPILHQVNIEDVYPVVFQAFHGQMSQKYNESYLRDQTMTWKVQLFFMNLQHEQWKERDNKVHLIELSGFVDFQIIFNQLSSEEEGETFG